MNIFNEPFYQAIFEQSSVPTAVLMADAPRFTFVATNKQYHITTHKVGIDLKGKGAFEVYNQKEGAGTQAEFNILVDCMMQCLNEKRTIKAPLLKFNTPAPDGKATVFSCWQIELMPIINQMGEVEYLMCSTHDVTAQEVVKLEAEWVHMREHKLNEELASANEEMTAINEELAITNEELAAANEELTVVTEELTASRESLQALNTELEDRVTLRTRLLAESELRLRSIFEQSPLALCVLNGPELIVAMANEQMLKLWDKTRMAIGMPYVQVRPDAEVQPYIELLNQVYTTGVPYIAVETKAYTSNKIWNYFDFTYQPLKDADGNTTDILVIVNEVTERVKARQQQQRANEQARLAKEAALLGTFDMNLATGELEWDARCRKLFGVSHNNPVSYEHDFLTGLHPDDKERVSRIVDNVFNKALTNGEFDTEYRTIGAEDKRLRWVKAKGRVLFDEHDKPVRFIGSVMDVTDQINSRREIEENERRFRFLLDAIPQQVWTATPEGALNYVNNVVCNDFGYNADEIVGHGWQAFIHPNDLPGCLNAWVTSLHSGKEYTVEFRLLFHDGSYHWHLARAVPFIENGEVSLWIGTNTNIDFQKSNEQRKDEFLSIASHELKTPLTSIKAFNQLMQRVQNPEKLGQFVQKSAEHITRLERLINDLLDVTKINAGKMVYDMQPFNFRQMLLESVESVQHISQLHQIIVEQADEVEFTGDRYRLEQVLNNFLTNAIKYSPGADRVIVNSKVEAGGLIVSVQDFGIGIAEESLDRLFDRYYRVDNTAMRFEGLGLGLFISSEILKRHQGSFWIESEQGKGSTFYFRLPLSATKENTVGNQTSNGYKDEYITIECIKEHSCLKANWTGFQTFESVKQGCMHMLDVIVQHNCTRILNDNREVMGTWSEAAEWVGEEFFPMMEKAGITHLAWIFSPSVFSQLSAKKSVDVAVGNITTQFFTVYSEAEKWVCG